jgi:hypothetical protein
MANWSDEQVKALHGLNSRLSGIRVITYDHLLAQGECLVNYLSESPEGKETTEFEASGQEDPFAWLDDEDDMPF